MADPMSTYRRELTVNLEHQGATVYCLLCRPPGLVVVRRDECTGRRRQHAAATPIRKLIAIRSEGRRRWLLALVVLVVLASSCGHSARRAAPPVASSTTTFIATPVPPSTTPAAPLTLTSTTTATPATVATSVAPTTANPAPPVPPTTVPPAPPPPATAQPTAWCSGRTLSAAAGPTQPFAGNGARVELTLRQAGPPCLVPASIEVRLTSAQGGTEAEALSAPASRATVTLSPSADAGLSLTWVRQGCFSPTVEAAGAYALWSSPNGQVEVAVAGVAADDIAPCHGAFGITNLQ